MIMKASHIDRHAFSDVDPHDDIDPHDVVDHNEPDPDEVQASIAHMDHALELAFVEMGARLRNIHCSVHGRTIILSGSVARYYFAQIAISAIRHLAHGRTIDCQIKVISSD